MKARIGNTLYQCQGILDVNDGEFDCKAIPRWTPHLGIRRIGLPLGNFRRFPYEVTQQFPDMKEAISCEWVDVTVILKCVAANSNMDECVQFLGHLMWGGIGSE